MGGDLCLELAPHATGMRCLRRKGHDGGHAIELEHQDDRVLIVPQFCAGILGPGPAYDYFACPMPPQPLKMDGDRAMLVGNAVGYRCFYCRYVFCASCAERHFGERGGIVDRLTQENVALHASICPFHLKTGELRERCR